MANGVDISQAIAGLRRLRFEVEAGAISALTGLAGDLQAELADTRVHGDVTGATRASYRVYVVHEGDDGSSTASDGAAAANDLNTGHGVVVRHGTIGDDVLLIASVFTDYAEDFVDQGGAKDAVSPFIARYGPQIASEAANGIKRRMGG